MEEHEQTTTNEPRWKAAGPPYLLTRAEVIAELQARGVVVTDRQLKSWATYGLLPTPILRVPPGATDGKARALHPLWVVGFIPDLLYKLRSGQTRESIVRYAPLFWQEWESHEPALLSFNPTGTGIDLDEYNRLHQAIQRAVVDYSTYILQATGRRVMWTEIKFTYEDGTQAEIGMSPHRLGDEASR